MPKLHPQLSADCHPLGRYPLSRLLLMNDSNYPWFILVPDRENIREIYQLADDDRLQLLRESCDLAVFLMQSFGGDKLNIAALGNQVPQLHLHHIVSYESDPAWPFPVWGRHLPVAYSPAALRDIRMTFAADGLKDFETA